MKTFHIARIARNNPYRIELEEEEKKEEETTVLFKVTIIKKHRLAISIAAR